MSTCHSPGQPGDRRRDSLLHLQGSVANIQVHHIFRRLIDQISRISASRLEAGTHSRVTARFSLPAMRDAKGCGYIEGTRRHLCSVNRNHHSLFWHGYVG